MMASDFSMRAKWRALKSGRSSAPQKVLDRGNIVRDGRKTPDASACRHRLLASRGGGGWNEQTRQAETLETKAAENKARPPGSRPQQIGGPRRADNGRAGQ